MKNINALLIITFIPCFYIFSSDLEKNLQFAGENRPELEKVLQHYGQSPANALKLKAAQFLIENMDAHSFYRSKSLNSYYVSLDSISSLNHISEPISSKQDSLFNNLQEPNAENLEEISDLKVVSADFLIDNIDRAFEAWKTPWNRDLSFEDFCEYLLPYRVSDECPAPWRKAYRDNMMPFVEHMMDMNSCNKGIKTNLTFEQSLKDVSGMKQQVKLNGEAVFTKGVKGSALILDGKENYLTLSYHDSVVPTNMTIMAWIFQNESKTWARVFDLGKDTASYMFFTTDSKGACVAMYNGQQIVQTYHTQPSSWQFSSTDKQSQSDYFENMPATVLHNGDAYTYNFVGGKVTNTYSIAYQDGRRSTVVNNSDGTITTTTDSNGNTTIRTF